MLHKSKSQIGQHLGFYISKCYHAVMWPVKSTNRNETGKNAFIISPGNTLTFSFWERLSHFFFEIRQGSSFAWSQKMFSKERKKVRMAMWMFRTLQPIIIQGQRKISSSLWTNCFDSELHNFLGNNLILFLTLCMVCSIEIFNFKSWIWQKAQNEPTGFWIGYLRPGLWSG